MRSWAEAGSQGCTLFATALGPCGVAWNAQALTQVLLPDVDAAATGRLSQHLSHAERVEDESTWPGFVRDAVAGMQALMRGEAAELTAVPIELERVQPFERSVYEATRRLGPGHTCSYGELARTIGAPDAARAVGVALGRNPWPLVVPCHRVLAAGGKLGGFSAPGGVRTKEQLLAIEAALVRRDGELF